MRQRYYNGSTTQITDPFFACRCPGGHAYWSVTYTRRCHECGKVLESCIPTTQTDKEKAASAN